ncbi:uncharacterized protein RJT21DRAFT_118418 [Scheffersomyces amazonensis]|uniref:uncharacterized protein n=1 Tax=Scheffersomyces amazonensis TaxID=1078765 RepID=UPI00315C73FE
MRSSIFSNDPPGLSSRKSKGYKKSKGSSPYISSPITPQLSTRTTNSEVSTPLLDSSLNSSINTSNLLNSQRPKKLSWNLDELISSYNDSGVLPPILSPTLPELILTPPQSHDSESVSKSTIVSPNPKHPMKKRLLIDDDDDDNNNNNNNNNNNTVQHNHNPHEEMVGNTKHQNSDHDEDVPLSMLSPTLPSMFDSRTSSSSTSTVNISNKPKTPKVLPLVRSVNKLHDPIKPKYFVRFNFRNKEKYRTIFTIRKSTETPKATGLGITTLDGENIERLTELKALELENKKMVDLAKELSEKQAKLDKKQLEFNNIDKQLKEKEKLLEFQINEKKSMIKEIEERDSKLKNLEKSLKAKELELEKQKQELKLQKQTVQSLPNNELQEKIEKLKQLNNDVITKESSQTPEEPIKLSIEEQQINNMPKSKRDEINSTLQSKKNSWLSIYKDSKAYSERYAGTDKLITVFCQIDGILSKIVAYDYDERSKLVTGVLPSERSWKLLDQETGELIINISKWTKDIQDIMLNGFFRIITCVLYQTRALIVKRINSILTKVIQSYIRKRSESQELNDKIIELQQSSILNNDIIATMFLNSRPDYLNISIPNKFAGTWSKRNTNIETVQKEYNLYDFNKNLRPIYQQYYLPLGSYSNITEMSGFLFNVVNEFIEVYNKHNPNNRIDYSSFCINN